MARTLDGTSFFSAEDALGGLTMLALGRVPRTGDAFERGNHRFEIMDMDGNRVDRVLVTKPEVGKQ